MLPSSVISRLKEDRFASEGQVRDRSGKSRAVAVCISALSLWPYGLIFCHLVVVCAAVDVPREDGSQAVSAAPTADANASKSNAHRGKRHLSQLGARPHSVCHFLHVYHCSMAKTSISSAANHRRTSSLVPRGMRYSPSSISQQIMSGVSSPSQQKTRRSTPPHQRQPDYFRELQSTSESVSRSESV